MSQQLDLIKILGDIMSEALVLEENSQSGRDQTGETSGSAKTATCVNWGCNGIINFAALL